MASNIQFHSLVKGFRITQKSRLIPWLESVVRKEKQKPGNLNIIFCSDSYLLKINQQHLNHDYYTDIITFQYSENQLVSGDLYISIDRVSENAAIYSTTFLNERNRVIVHGVLHLCGYTDKTKKAQKLIREKEDYYLNKLK